ncbi:TolC family protein [bacterium]|nr:TolC family protein [bacterium]
MNRYVRSLIILVFSISLFGGAAAQTQKMTLNECVDIALKQNPNIIMSLFSKKIASKDVIESFSQFLPQISAGMGYYHSVLGPSSKMRIDPRTGIPVPIQPFELKSWSSSASINVNQQLFSGGRNLFNVKRSRYLQKSAYSGFDDTKQQTIYIVKERYYNLLKAEHLLSIAEETTKSSGESYKRAQTLFRVGKVPKSDVLKAKVQLETDKLSLIEAQNGLSVARASLNYVLGYSVDHAIEVVDNLNVSDINVSYDDAMTQAFSEHPALKKKEWDVKAARASVRMAYGQFLPTVSAYYSYSWRNDKLSKIDKMFDKDYNWYAGVQLNFPIFQGLSRYATVSKAQLAYSSQKIGLEQAKRDIALEVKQAFFQVKQAKKKILVTKDALAAAEEDLRLNKEKYNLGAGTMLDLINAQVSYTRAKSDNVQALYDYKYSIARLEKAMGVLNK